MTEAAKRQSAGSRTRSSQLQATYVLHLVCPKWQWQLYLQHIAWHACDASKWCGANCTNREQQQSVHWLLHAGGVINRVLKGTPDMQSLAQCCHAQ
jgi:hypothetical protein